MGAQFGNVVISLSKYADCLFVFVNQTGTIGSIVSVISRRSRELLLNHPQN